MLATKCKLNSTQWQLLTSTKGTSRWSPIFESEKGSSASDLSHVWGTFCNLCQLLYVHCHGCLVSLLPPGGKATYYSLLLPLLTTPGGGWPHQKRTEKTTVKQNDTPPANLSLNRTSVEKPINLISLAWRLIYRDRWDLQKVSESRCPSPARVRPYQRHSPQSKSTWNCFWLYS